MKNHIYKFYLLYFGIIAVAYSLPTLVSSIFLIGLFIYGIFIEKDIIKWLALFLLISNSPGYIFGFADANYDLQNLGIGLTAERGISFQEFFFILLFILALSRNIKFRSIFKRIYTFIGVYIFIMFILTIYDLDFFKILRTLRGFIPHLAYFFFPILLVRSSEYRRLLILLIPFPIFVLFVQFFELLTQQEIILTLGSSLDWEGSIREGVDIARQNYSQILLLFILFASVYILNYNKDKEVKVYSNQFLYIIIGTINISIFLSATRGYFLASIIGTLLYMLISFNPGKIVQAAFWVIISIVMLSQTPIVSNQFSGALDRIATIDDIVTDIEGAGMEETSRIMYFRDMMNNVAEKPVFGYGFSQKFWEYSNIHSGIATNLINGGIVGSLLLLILFAALLFKATRYKDIRLKLLAIAFISLIIVHSTSNYVFNFVHLSQSDGRIIIPAIIFSFFSTIIYEQRYFLSKSSSYYA